MATFLVAVLNPAAADGVMLMTGLTVTDSAMAKEAPLASMTVMLKVIVPAAVGKCGALTAKSLSLTVPADASIATFKALKPVLPLLNRDSATD